MFFKYFVLIWFWRESVCCKSNTGYVYVRMCICEYREAHRNAKHWATSCMYVRTSAQFPACRPLCRHCVSCVGGCPSEPWPPRLLRQTQNHETTTTNGSSNQPTNQRCSDLVGHGLTRLRVYYNAAAKLLR